MKHRLASLCLAVSLLAGLFGCSAAPSAGQDPAATPGSTAAPSAAPAPTPLLDTDAPGAQTVASAAVLPSLLGQMDPLYDQDLVPAVPDYPVEPDFSNVINADRMEYWSEEARQTLLENGFLVIENNNHEFFSTYESNRYNYEPNFVTVDAMLHTYHLYFAYLQKQVEKEELCGRLLALSQALQQQSQTQWQALAGTEWENAALRNLAFFTVGACLLDPDTPVPEAVAAPVAQELALIEAAETTALSPVMNLGGDGGADGLKEDYTQYIPRSYYAGDETLERYFRGMMWYGRLTFRAASADETRSALLACLALEQAGVQADWDRLYAVTAFFAGVSDDAVVSDYRPLIESAYGGLPETGDLPGQTAAFDAFADSVGRLAPAAINSIPIYEDEDRDAATKGFRFLGQRFTLDAAVFQQLVYPQVEANGQAQRMLPAALDLPAALGSDRARALLDEAGQTDYPNYDEQLDKVRARLAEAPDTAWNASLYAAWLNALRPLAEAKGAGWPAYMQTDAWTAKSLTSLLGSWTELKHDTALYAKQIYAEMGGGGMIEERDDRGYVEAEPVVFGRLSALCTATANGLDALGLLPDDAAEDLSLLAEMNRRFMTIAEKELRNELPTDEEFELIRSFGGQLEHFWTETVADPAGIYTPLEMPAALVSDVATDPNGSVLQVATSVNTIYVIVPVEGSLRIASGTVFAFHEFTRPQAERLTDSQWQSAMGLIAGEDGLLRDVADRPDPAAWTRPAMLDVSALWQR